ncbi:ABC transporter permease [Rhodococcus sp. 14C212]|uniref:ABC transporter permease n=1 Tax=Rhodococcus sp. 14C212 TaxID=2711209 RepID=UPI0013ED2DB3|nr:ABC transporter permease [Rhodococcus sp. 14C212]
MTSTADRRAGTPAAVVDVLHVTGPRPTPASAFAASLSFGWRALLRIKHVPEQLFDVTVFPLMFTLLFTYLFGGALAGSTTAYVQFLIPGILVQTVCTITMYTGMTLNRDIEKGVFDRFRSMPVWRPAPLVGALFGDLARYTLASVIVLALGMMLGFRPMGGPIGTIGSVALVLLFAFSLSWIWTMLAMLLRTEQAVMGVSMTILFPLTFASNVFVDPATMPSWLQGFVTANPISRLVTAIRDLMAGTPDAAHLAIVFAWCAALIVLFGPATMWLYNRRS